MLTSKRADTAVAAAALPSFFRHFPINLPVFFCVILVGWLMIWFSFGLALNQKQIVTCEWNFYINCRHISLLRQAIIINSKAQIKLLCNTERERKKTAEAAKFRICTRLDKKEFFHFFLQDA